MKYRALASLIVLLAAGCSGGSKKSSPVNVTLTPPADAPSVGATSVISATFSAPMDAATIDGTSFLVSVNAVPVSGTVTYSGMTASFRADGLLPFAKSVDAKLTSAIQDADGLPIKAVRWSFTVEPDNYKEAFVTSETGTADFSSWPSAGGMTGIAAADAICTAAATTAGFSGQFRALLSDANDDAWCRIAGVPGGQKNANCGLGSLPSSGGPWLRVRDLYPFAADLPQLFSNASAPWVPISYDEKGHAAAMLYWTNTALDGRNSGYISTVPCANWTTATVSTNVLLGFSEGTDAYWLTGSIGGCDLVEGLLCLETGAGTPVSLPPPPPGALRAFVTGTQGQANLSGWSDAGGQTGLAAGDAICVAEATAAGLPNASSFKAWLSTSTADAASRLTSNGPWVRTDGVLLANDKADLLDGTLFSSIDRKPDGNPFGAIYVWTGTANDGTRTSFTCSDWTDGTGGATASYGNTGGSASVLPWSGSTSNDFCLRSEALYCFED